MRVRRTPGRKRGALGFHDQTDAFISGALMLVGLIAIVVMAFVMPPTSTVTAPPLDIPRGPARSGPEPVVRFMNQAGGYSFAYPKVWDLSEAGAVSRLESPNGNVVLTFGVTVADELVSVVARSVRSLAGPLREDKVIGTSREHIAGSPAFMRSGMTRDETGTSIRYLAIAVDGDDRTYTISITVPAHVDPENVLSTVESIVTSFGTTQPVLVSS